MTAERQTASVASGLAFGGPELLIGVGMLLACFVATVGTPADPDLWGHLTFGRDIVATRAIVQSDRYSFTSDRPWTNHEWLSEVTYFLTYRMGGPVGLIAFKCAATILMIGLLWWHLRRFNPATWVLALLLFLAFVGTHWRVSTVRPQLFSVLLFTSLVIAITEADAGRRRLLWCLPLLMVLWVNLHGGWIVGVGTLGIWTGLGILDRAISARERLVMAIVGITTLLATLMNPYGFELWKFLFETVRLQRPDIQEWKSVTAFPAVVWVPWILVLCGGVLAIWRGGWPRRSSYVAIVAMLAVASFRVSRLDAFFTLATVVLLAPQLIAAFRAAPGKPALLRQAEVGGAGALVITVVACAAMIATALVIARPSLSCINTELDWLPEADAGRFIALNRLHGRLLSWFDWGEYAIWHFGPGLLVSLDGRRETVYSEPFILAHQQFYYAEVEQAAFVERIKPDYIWLPNRLPSVRRLRQDGWAEIFHGPLSTVFARPGGGPFQRVEGKAPGPRCFPGP